MAEPSEVGVAARQPSPAVGEAGSLPATAKQARQSEARAERRVCVNGVYEEVPVNSSFEPVADGEPIRTLGDFRRFDKVAQLDGLPTTFSILFTVSLEDGRNSASWTVTCCSSPWGG